MNFAKRAMRALLDIGWRPIRVDSMTSERMDAIKRDPTTINVVSGYCIADAPLDKLCPAWARFSRSHSTSSGGILEKNRAFYGKFELEEDEGLVPIAPRELVRSYWDGRNR